MKENSMKKYIGVKLVQAEPMARGFFEKEYAECTDTDRTSDCTPGYRVVYADGYCSWCPEDVFEDANTEIRESCNELKDYQVRVAIERKELGVRIESLSSLIASDLFKELPVIDRALLKSQLASMQEYSELLGIRVSLFK